MPDLDVVPETENNGASAAPAEWWQAEGLPWKHKPTREELWCYGLLMFYSLYGLLMIPLRGWLITVPYFSAMLNGSRTAIALVGAFTSSQHGSRWLGFTALAVSILSAVKWDLLYWWAGKLWGEAFIGMVAGQKGRGKKLSEQLEHLATKRPAVSMFVTYLPIPFTAVIYAVLGAARYDWKKFLALDIVCSAIFNQGYFALGWYVGQPAVDLLLAFSKYALWVSLGLMVVMIVVMYRRRSEQAKTRAMGD